LVSLNAFARTEPAGKSAVGTWKLDLSKSSFGNMPAPKFEQMAISKDEPSAIKWSLTSAMQDGKTRMESYDGPVDGKEHGMTSPDGPSTVAYTRTANGVLQWTIKDGKGNTVETGAGQLSPDGRMLTLKGTMNGPNGKANFTAVYNRTK
jgi:hypothetical protein